MNPHESAAAAVAAYLADNGFSVEAYTAPTATISVGPLTFSIPNPPARRRVIALHDLHHVATGYGTDLTGEAEIGAFELRGGCPSAFLVLINAAAVLLGLLIAPRRIYRAFRRARGARTLYALGMDASAAGILPVVELRRRLGVAPDGVGDPALRCRHRLAPPA